jgi:hypothetical protein
MSNNPWVNNLQIEFKEEPDGSGTIVIEWDENDCSLEQWMSWGEEKQKQFILDALTLAVSDALNDNET